MYRIFLVEDDAALATAVKKQIENYGNQVICAENFEDVAGEFFRSNAQLVLMDIKLPYRDGYSWCSEIRRSSQVPVIFLSSAAESMNIVMAMTMGGDDFIAKPVDPMVLNAKIGAVLRRSYEISQIGNFMEFHGAILNPSDGTVLYDGKTIDLTKNEQKILAVLLENKGVIVSREALMTRLWQSDLYVEENTLTVNVARLRKKLEENGLADVIVTKPGSGYILQ